MDTNSEVLTLSKKIYALRMQNNLNHNQRVRTRPKGASCGHF